MAKHEVSRPEGSKRPSPLVFSPRRVPEQDPPELLEKDLSISTDWPHPTLNLIPPSTAPFTHPFFTFDSKALLSGQACPTWL